MLVCDGGLALALAVTTNSCDDGLKLLFYLLSVIHEDEGEHAQEAPDTDSQDIGHTPYLPSTKQYLTSPQRTSY